MFSPMPTAKFAAAILKRNLKLKIWQTKDLLIFLIKSQVIAIN